MPLFNLAIDINNWHKSFVAGKPSSIGLFTFRYGVSMLSIRILLIEVSVTSRYSDDISKVLLSKDLVYIGN